MLAYIEHYKSSHQKVIVERMGQFISAIGAITKEPECPIGLSDVLPYLLVLYELQPARRRF